jgi:hypothetical protein
VDDELDAAERCSGDRYSGDRWGVHWRGQLAGPGCGDVCRSGDISDVENGRVLEMETILQSEAFDGRVGLGCGAHAKWNNGDQ